MGHAEHGLRPPTATLTRTGVGQQRAVLCSGVRQYWVEIAEIGQEKSSPRLVPLGDDGQQGSE